MQQPPTGSSTRTKRERERRGGLRWWHRCTPLLLLLPFLGLMAFLAAGMLSAMVQSFGYIPAFDLHELTFGYYRELFTGGAVLDSLWLSLRIAFSSAMGATVLGVILCTAIVSLRRRKSGALLLIRLPILVPHTVTALFIIMLFSQSGLIARALYAGGLIGGQEDVPRLLFTPNGTGMILAYLWKEVPFVAYFVAALMGSIQSTLGEAAQNLGASPTKTFFHVTLPLSFPAIANAFLIIFAYAFGSYEVPFLLGSTLPRALPVQAYLEYTHPDLRHRPYAMAMNGMILVVSLLLALVYYALLRRKLQGKAVGA